MANRHFYSLPPRRRPQLHLKMTERPWISCKYIQADLFACASRTSKLRRHSLISFGPTRTLNHLAIHFLLFESLDSPTRYRRRLLLCVTKRSSRRQLTCLNGVMIHIRSTFPVSFMMRYTKLRQ